MLYLLGEFSLSYVILYTTKKYSVKNYYSLGCKNSEEDKMKIQRIQFRNEGWVYCKSTFYCANDILQPKAYSFKKGIHILKGEIDSGVWAVSYYLSMFSHRAKDFVMDSNFDVLVDNDICDIKTFCDYSCYLDKKLYPYFSQEIPINELIEKYSKNNTGKSAEEIRELFQITEARFNRPVNQMGNEAILGMAAVGYSMGKQVFCFPWMSAERFRSNSICLSRCLDALEKLGMIVIIPVGKKSVKVSLKNFWKRNIRERVKTGYLDMKMKRNQNR